MQPRVLLVGDSITEYSFDEGGWGASLSNWYARRADVINRGFDGWNTRWILKHKDRIRSSLGPAPAGTYVVGTLMLGANDNSTSYQHVPLEEYTENVEAIARWMIEDVGVKHLLVMGPPPYCAKTHTEYRQLPLEHAPRADERHAAYGDAAKGVAAKVGAGFVSLRDAIREALGDDWSSALYDGLHLGPSGNKIAAEAIKKALTEQFPDASPTEMGHWLLPDFTAFEQYPCGNVPEASK
jgi:lysophospholipase L1-like esterase